MNFSIWTYVSFLGGVVAIVILLVLLFEIIVTFISNRKKQALQEELFNDAENLFREEIEKKIKEELDKAFKK